MRITLEQYESTYEVEIEQEDMSAGDLVELFTRILVVAGYPPSVIIPKDDEKGSYQFVRPDETIIRREQYDKENSGN